MGGKFNSQICQNIYQENVMVAIHQLQTQKIQLSGAGAENLQWKDLKTSHQTFYECLN